MKHNITLSLPAIYRRNGWADTSTALTPSATSPATAPFTVTITFLPLYHCRARLPIIWQPGTDPPARQHERQIG